MTTYIVRAMLDYADYSCVVNAETPEQALEYAKARLGWGGVWAETRVEGGTLYSIEVLDQTTGGVVWTAGHEA